MADLALVLALLVTSAVTAQRSARDTRVIGTGLQGQGQVTDFLPVLVLLLLILVVLVIGLRA